MYNGDTKNRFLSEQTSSSSRRYVEVFNAVEQEEEAAGRDIGTFDIDELRRASIYIGGTRASTADKNITLINKYMKWYLQSGLPGATGASMDSELAGVERLRTLVVLSPLQLKQYLDELFEQESLLTVHNVYRCYCWLAFMGLTEKDALRVKKTDVFLSDRVIRYCGEEYTIYEEAIPSVTNCVRLDAFRYINPNYTNRVDVFKERAESDLLLATTSAVVGNTSQSIYRDRMARLGAKANKEGRTKLKLGYYRIWLSGLFYRTYNQEVAQIPIDFHHIAYIRLAARSGFDIDSKETTKRNVKVLANELEVDYKRWKQLLPK